MLRRAALAVLPRDVWTSGLRSSQHAAPMPRTQGRLGCAAIIRASFPPTVAWWASTPHLTRCVPAGTFIHFEGTARTVRAGGCGHRHSGRHGCGSTEESTFRPSRRRERDRRARRSPTQSVGQRTGLLSVRLGRPVCSHHHQQPRPSTARCSWPHRLAARQAREGCIRGAMK